MNDISVHNQIYILAVFIGLLTFMWVCSLSVSFVRYLYTDKKYKRHEYAVFVGVDWAMSIFIVLMIIITFAQVLGSYLANNY
jgi:hypothetical protein